MPPDSVLHLITHTDVFFCFFLTSWPRALQHGEGTIYKCKKSSEGLHPSVGMLISLLLEILREEKF